MNKPDMQILIVEDEALIAQDIAFILKNNGYSVCGIAHTAEKAIELINKNPPALALLDIRIEGAIDGLMLAGIIKDRYQFPFIFLTSYTDKDTLDRVKELQPSGFIVKPFNSSELFTNIELSIERFKNEETQTTAQWENTENDHFYVKRNSDLIKIRACDILFAQAFDNYCYINTDKEKFLIPHTLKSVEKKLEPYNFFRIHRSFVVNLASVDVISEDCVQVKSTTIPISRTARPELMQKISLL